MKFFHLFAASPSVPLLFAALAFAGSPAAAPADAQTRVSVAVTETSGTYNPLGDSNSLMYGVWCHVYGCLIEYDFDKADYVGNVAESWETPASNTWIFHLREDLTWHNGAPFTAADVLHSYNRVLTDPQSKQKQNLRPVADMEAIDDHTIKVTTKQPTAPLLAYLSQFIITNKAIFDEFGAKAADREHPVGLGPYKLATLVPGQRFVLEKHDGHPDLAANAPDEIIYEIVREPEARVIGLLNDEYQIIQRVLPQLMQRVEENSATRIDARPSVEIMFLGMSPQHEPWGNAKLRQAVCYALDRDAILEHVLKGQAERLDGLIGPGQYGYDSATALRYPYDPEKARALVRKAGYPDGVDVALYTSNGRYLLDKTIGESMVPMLAAVGIRATLHTPEVSTYWSNIQRGKVPFYYWGRGSVIDPSPALAQYFETGGSPRLGFSDPKVDALLQAERTEMNAAKRKKALNAAFDAILDAAPACFLWRYKIVYGVAKSVDFTPRPDNRIIPSYIRMAQ